MSHMDNSQPSPPIQYFIDDENSGGDGRDTDDDYIASVPYIAQLSYCSTTSGRVLDFQECSSFTRDQFN